ncbi:MAG TPA: SRPBCC family protein [Cyclobacteriaceae bacterium]|nr:SRPBCC family protein [Cyclobacteriaceae bacterium]
MIRIYNETVIQTTQERCFDLSRSIDFHKVSMHETKEIPVAGRVSGLIELGEFVGWEATHLFVRQRLSSKITEMVRPHYFVDEMVKGAFRSFHHKHEVIARKTGDVIMIDDFRYEAPLGVLGGFANFLFLRKYMERVIGARSAQLKAALESDQWKEFLS